MRIICGMEFPEPPCGYCHECGLELELIYGTGAQPLEWCEGCGEFKGYRQHLPGWGQTGGKSFQITQEEGDCRNIIVTLPLTSMEFNGHVLETGMDLQDDRPLRENAPIRRTWLDRFVRHKVSQKIMATVDSESRTKGGSLHGGSHTWMGLEQLRPLERQLSLFPAVPETRRRRRTA